MSKIGNNQKIKYIMIGKAQDLKEIGEYPSQTVSEWSKDCKKIFSNYCASNIQGKIEQRNKVKVKESNFNHYFYINSQQIFFIALVETSFPEYLVFKLFEEINKENIPLLRDEKGKLNTIGLSKLKDLVNQYQVANDKNTISQINKDIDDIKGNMRSNITGLVANIDDVEALKVQSDSIKDKSSDFYTKSDELKKAACWNNYKLWLILGLVIIVIIIIVVVVIVSSNSSDDNSDNNDDSSIDVNSSSNSTDSGLRFLKSVYDNIVKEKGYK